MMDIGRGPSITKQRGSAGFVLREERDSLRRKTRGRTACKQCRQVKVRCGLERIPCPRCERLGYECIWDPKFKRANNPNRVRELEANLQALQNIIDDGGAREPPPLAASSDHELQQSGSEPCNSMLQVDSQTGPEHRSMPISGSTKSNCSEDAQFVVLDVSITTADAGALFTIFFEKYHPFVPFLDPTKPLKSYYSCCELLFWTIISIAAQELQPERDFVARLAPYLTSSVGQMILGPPLRLSQVQALLLLSLWPPFNVHWWTDRSLTLSNLAVMGALHLGLHCPFYEHEYTPRRVDISESDRIERTSTWVACLAISQNLAMDFGIPIRLFFDNWSVAAVCNANSRLQISVELQHYLTAQRIGYFASESFSTCIVPETGLHDDDLLARLLERFNNDLTNLEVSDWSFINRLRLATVKLNVQNMYFQLNPGNPARKSGILQAYSTATGLVNLVMADEGSTQALRNSPRTTYRMLWVTATTIFKVLHSSYRSELDFNLGKILYNATSLCIRQQAVQYREKDIPNRCADLLRTLWRLGEKDPVMSTMEPTLRCRTRLGASVAYDCLSIWRKRNNDASNGIPRERAVASNHDITSELSLPTKTSLDGDYAIQDNVIVDYMTFPWDGDLDYSDPFSSYMD